MAQSHRPLRETENRLYQNGRAIGWCRHGRQTTMTTPRWEPSEWSDFSPHFFPTGPVRGPRGNPVPDTLLPPPCGSFLADFGIRDMNEYSSREHLSAAIMDEVTLNIDQYEPRLQLVSISVEDTDDPFRIAFKIECRVRETAQALFMEFDSVYNDFNINTLHLLQFVRSAIFNFVYCVRIEAMKLSTGRGVRIRFKHK